jgi:hypothetical protein
VTGINAVVLAGDSKKSLVQEGVDNKSLPRFIRQFLINIIHPIR